MPILRNSYKIGIILFAFLCISIAVAGCSQQSTPQRVEQVQQVRTETIVDTTQRVEGVVQYPLSYGKWVKILVTSDVPVNIYQYGTGTSGGSAVRDLDPPANGITYYKNDNFCPVNFGSEGQVGYVNIKGISIHTSLQYPVANVHITITRDY
jgi:hypothetical protein